MVTCVAASLGVTLAPSEIITSFRIPARDVTFRSQPLIAKLIIIARRGELLACARRRWANFIASIIHPFWPNVRVFLQERAMAVEKRIFREAR